MIGNKRVLTEFVSTDGRNINIKGTFSTANPEIITALEESPDFNREYYLHSEENIIEPVKETIQFRANPLEVKKFREEKEKESGLTEDEIVKKRAETKEPEAPEPIEVKIVGENVVVEPKVETKNEIIVPATEVSNFQAAKKYLKDRFPELQGKDLLNKDKVLQAANDKAIKFEALS
jgi:hypothetical protein